MSLGKYFWDRYPLFQRFLKEPSRNLTLWWCDRLTPISFSSCSVNQEKCHISWKPGDKIAFFVLETVMARVTWVTFTASDLHRSFQLEFVSTGFRAGAVSRVPGGSFRHWDTKSNFKANTEWWAGSVCNRLQIASLHAFSHDARLLSKPRSSPSILVLRHDHGTSVSSFRWESTRPWATRTPENLSLHDLSQISPRAEKRLLLLASCSANNKSLLASYC